MGDAADPHRLSELHFALLQHGIFSPQDVHAFSEIWYCGKRDHSVTDNRSMNAILDQVRSRFEERPEEEQETVRGQLTAFRNLYAFLSQIIPYQDSELEQFYTFVRNLLLKLPPPNSGDAFILDDEVALKFYRIQQMTEGSINLGKGEADPLKGPTDVGTGKEGEKPVPLSSLVQKLNERFGTDFKEADQLFFDQIRASAEENAKIVEAAKANNLSDFSSYLERVIDELFIERMEGNEEIFTRVMSDKSFRSAAQEHLAKEIFARVRGAGSGNEQKD
jgi:type I restriction enzyme R subunit